MEQTSEKVLGVRSTFERLKTWTKEHQGRAILIGLLALLLGIPFVIALWFVVIPAAGAWYVWKKTNLSRRVKIGTVLAAVVIAIGLANLSSYASRPPVITITVPENGISVQDRRIEVTGTVSPKDSTVTINLLPATVNPDGTFTGIFLLKEEQNTATIEAKKGDRITTTTLAVARVFTEEEKAERALAAAKAKQEQEAKEAAEKAAQAAYDRSPAGKACKAHPEWTKDDCESLMGGKIWVGMEYDMLVYKWGRPDHINPSNYGRGTSYQYCWMDYNPSCFYDRNGDGILDAYN